MCAPNDGLSRTAQYAKREFDGMRAALDSSRLMWLRTRNMARESEDVGEAVRRSLEERAAN